MKKCIAAPEISLKNYLFFFILFCACAFQNALYGQATVQVSGTVKAQQGAIQQAHVEFLNLNDEFQTSGITGTNGVFRSEKKLAVGRTVKIKITMAGYRTLVKDMKITATGDAGEFRLERSNLMISGFVRDSISGLVLSGVEISFYNDQGKLIKARSNTDTRGYYDLETNFVFGQKITIRVFKKGYYDDKELTQTFSSEGRTSLPDILLPELGDRGLRAFVRITNKKTGKPLGGVNIHFLDRKKSAYIDSVVPATGELQLKLYQRPGTTLDMQITRPNYLGFKANPTLSEDPQVNQFSFPMEKEGRSSLGPVLLTVSGAAALTGGGMFYLSTKQYSKYKNFGNAKREDDLKGAELKRSISAVAGGAATAALMAYIITKVKEKNKEKAIERNKIRTSFIPVSPFNYAHANIAVIGLVYSF